MESGAPFHRRIDGVVHFQDRAEDLRNNRSDIGICEIERNVGAGSDTRCGICESAGGQRFAGTVAELRRGQCPWRADIAIDARRGCGA